jgi:EmrB/QacA subfamily drug resistance transporter
MIRASGTKGNANVLMAIIMLTQFLSAFMGASVNIALPGIAEDFSMSAVSSSWVVMSFLLSTGMFLLVFGKLGDILGRKKVFLAGIVLFAVSSLLCAFSVNALMLILSRLAQGISGAMLMSTAMAIITTEFPPQKRGKMLGLAVSSVYVGMTLAPVLGGVMTQMLGWQSIFLAGVLPVVFVALAHLFKFRIDGSDTVQERFDITGSVIYVIAILLLMYGLSLLPGFWGIVMTVSGITALAGFIWFESRIQNPILNTGLFRYNRVFAFSNLAALINYSATFAITFVLSLYLQYVKGMQPGEAGLLLITQPAVMALTAGFAGRLSDKTDPRIIASAGMGIITAGLIALCFIDSHTPETYIVLSLVVVGLGFGAFSSPNTNAVMSSVGKKDMGVAAAIVSSMRVLGQILSIALAAMVFQLFLGDEKISSDNIPGFITGVRTLFVVFVALCFLGVFASLARGPQRKTGNQDAMQ